MTAAETAALLEQTFGPAVTGKKLDALDPFVTLDPARLVDVCTFLRDDPVADGSHALDRDLDNVARIEPHRRLPGKSHAAGGTGGDDVTGPQRRE